MKKPRKNISAEKEQELLLNALSSYVQKITGSDPEHTDRFIRMTQLEILNSRNITFHDARFLPHREREGLVELAAIAFLRKAKVSYDLHEKIMHGSLLIYRKWVNSVRNAAGRTEIELHTMIDDILKKHSAGTCSTLDFYRRPDYF